VGKLVLKSKHRLLCGDSTLTDDVERALGGSNMTVCITDPPYSVNYDISAANAKSTRGAGELHESYSCDRPEEVNHVLSFMDRITCDVIVMSYPVDRHFFSLADALKKNEFEFRKELVWVKDRFSFWMSAKYQQKHEPILWIVRKGKPLGGDVPADQSTVLEFPKPVRHDLHPTAKPIALWELLVTHHSKKGDLVFEPFCGSGTTIIACERLDRRCVGIEMSPNFMDVILERWVKFTDGGDPVREDGVRWSDLQSAEPTEGPA
jgi:DNA modification methylase